MTPLELPDDGTDRRADGRAEVLGLALGGGLNLGGMALSQLAGFAILAVLATTLGSRDVGLYSQAYAFLAILELLALSGFRSGLTRFVAVHLADDDAASLRGTLRLGLGISVGSAVLLGIALFLSAPWLAERAFDDPGLQSPLRLVAVALLPTVFGRAALSATQGFRTMRYYAGVGLLAVPALRLALTLGANWVGAGLQGAMMAVLASEAIGAVVAGLALRALVPASRARPRYRVRELFDYSMVSWLASLASTGLLWADTILLGLYLSSAEVGRYQVVARLVLFAALAVAPLCASFAPRIAYLHHLGATESLHRAYVATSSWILQLSLPAFVVLLVFPKELTTLFGRGFEVAWAVPAVLVAGKLTDVATGPCGLMLNQSGRVRLNLADNVAVLVANIGLNLWLIPRYHLLGSAVAWAVSLIVVNVARLLQVRSTMGMWPFGAATAKGLAAAVPALAAAGAVQVAADGLAALVGGALATGVVYLAALALLRLEPDDRLVLAALLRRRGFDHGIELRKGADDNAILGF